MKVTAISLVALAILATPAAAENWNAFSRTQTNAYMVDIDRLGTGGDVSTALVAKIPLRGDAGDYSHSIETYEIRCGPKQWRTAGAIEYGPDGAQLDSFPEENATWEDVRTRTLPDYLRQIVCDGDRAAPPNWPTIKAFVDAGRP